MDVAAAVVVLNSGSMQRGIVMSVYVCLCVCLSASIFPELHLAYTTSGVSQFCDVPLAVARSSSGGVAMRYVLPVYG